MPTGQSLEIFSQLGSLFQSRSSLCQVDIEVASTAPLSYSFIYLISLLEQRLAQRMLASVPFSCRHFFFKQTSSCLAAISASDASLTIHNSGQAISDATYQ